MVPQFKFTFTNTSLYPSGVSVNQPAGWKEVAISLRRDPNYHSLVKYFESGFIWYGKALEKINEIVDDQGVGAIIGVTIEIRSDSSTFTTLFTGTLDVSLAEYIYDKVGVLYKVKAPIVRDTFWSRFISKADTKVDLQSTTDLYGGTRTLVDKVLTKLPSQIIVKKVNLERRKDMLLTGFVDGNINGKYINIQLDDPKQDEIGISNVSNSNFIWDVIENLLASESFSERGNAEFSVRYEASLMYRRLAFNGDGSLDNFTFYNESFASDPNEFGCSLDIFIQFNNETPIALAKTHYTVGGGIGSTMFFYSATRMMEIGDKVKVYARNTSVLTTSASQAPIGSRFPSPFTQINCVPVETLNFWSFFTKWAIYGTEDGEYYVPEKVYRTWDGSGGGGCSMLVAGLVYSSTNEVLDTYNFPAPYSGAVIRPTYFDVIFESEMIGTTTDAYLLKDAAESIVSKIVGQDGVVNSAALSTPLNWGVLLRGKHVRGYSFTEKPFTMSWNEWFKAVCQIHPFGVGYTNSNELEIEPIADFYSQTPSITLDNFSNLVRTVDQENLYNKLTFQFAKWSAESGSGIDDPQTKREWFTPLQQIGKEFIVNVMAYCASLGIEQTRRNRVELGKDWRLDEDLMLIAVIPDGGDWTAEKNENYDTVTNLLTPSKRYNLRHTPTRIFQRWKNYLQSVLHFYSSSNIVFSSGEGNVTMTSEIKATDTEAGVFTSGVIAENSNFAITSSKIFKGDNYTCEAPLTMDQFDTIDANRKQCIQISIGGVLTKFAIMDLKYYIVKGSAKLTLKAI